METVTDFIFLVFNINAELDCSHKIKRHFFLGRKAMRSLESILKIRDIALPTKVPIIKAMVFLVVNSRCVSWTIKKTEGWRIGAFEMWGWRRLWRVPWTVKRSNQSILRESTLDIHSVQFSSVQSLSRVRLFVAPWIAVCQASLSITNSQSLLKLMSIELVMPSSHLILCRPLLLLSPIPLSIRVFSNESTTHMRWPKYWSFSCSIIRRINSKGETPTLWTPDKSWLIEKKKSWCWERLKPEKERNGIGRPSMLQSMVSQRVKHNLATKQQHHHNNVNDLQSLTSIFHHLHYHISFGFIIVLKVWNEL